MLICSVNITDGNSVSHIGLSAFLVSKEQRKAVEIMAQQFTECLNDMHLISECLSLNLSFISDLIFL